MRVPVKTSAVCLRFKGSAAAMGNVAEKKVDNDLRHGKSCFYIMSNEVPLSAMGLRVLLVHVK